MPKRIPNTLRHKVCPVCGIHFTRPLPMSLRRWRKRIYCSYFCFLLKIGANTENLPAPPLNTWIDEYPNGHHLFESFSLSFNEIQQVSQIVNEIKKTPKSTKIYPRCDYYRYRFNDDKCKEAQANKRKCCPDCRHLKSYGT